MSNRIQDNLKNNVKEIKEGFKAKPTLLIFGAIAILIILFVVY